MHLYTKLRKITSQSAERLYIFFKFLYENVMTLAVRQLSFGRGEKRLQSLLNFSVKNGEALWIKGPNGVGKSTLIEILCGFRRYDGEILWNGKKITPNNDAYHEAICYIGHKNGNAPAMTAWEALAFYGQLYDEKNIDEALDKMQLMHRRDVPVSSLSAGQQRRLALARLILLKKPIWFLDEPTVSLDKEGAKLIGELIADHIQEGGMVIFTSHIENLVKDCAELTLTPINQNIVNSEDSFLGEGWSTVI